MTENKTNDDTTPPAGDTGNDSSLSSDLSRLRREAAQDAANSPEAVEKREAQLQAQNDVEEWAGLFYGILEPMQELIDINDKQARMLATGWAPCAAKYFGGPGQAGPEFTAISVTLIVFGPRMARSFMGTPAPRHAEKSDGEDNG